MVYVYVDLILALYPMVYVYMYTGTVSCYTQNIWIYIGTLSYGICLNGSIMGHFLKV